MTEITYKMPAEDIRKQRQVFHSLNRKPGESMDFWIYRIDVCSRVCDYGVLTEHMLIDKFMSGLTEDEFDDFSCWGKININKVMLIIFTKTELDICDQVEMSPQFNVQPENTIVNSSISTNQIGVESMNQSNLEDHTYTMTKPQLKGFKTFDSNHVMCLDCHRVFLKTSYSVHRNWHTGGWKNCSICGKMNKTFQSYRHHMEIHKGAKRRSKNLLAGMKKPKKSLTNE